MVTPETRGVFRIPGSIRVVNELYEFYCAGPSADVASTVRSPNLPVHINAGIHDIASCFKKFLSGLPGGILGSLSLFDAMIAINSQLYGDPEFSRTKQSKIRARLIALAIGTLRSQFRRELICAVFGLLCLLGRAAETAPREDECGRPLPTSDLMGYNALGIVFGPLLVGDMLGSYAVKLADPSSGLFIVPRSPSSSSKSQKGKKKAKEATEDPGQPPFLDVDKIHVANNITEMLITNWRDVVRQMRSLDTTMGVLRSRSRSQSSFSNNKPRRSSSFGRNSENDLILASPREEYTDSRLRSSERYTKDDPRHFGQYTEDRHARAGASGTRAVSFKQIDSTNDALSVRKTRSMSTRNISNTLSSSGPKGALSPPREESADEEREVHPAMRLTTPLKSSLKSSNSKKCSNFPDRRGQISDKNTSPEYNDAFPPPPPRSTSRVASGISPIKKHFETLEAQHRQRVPSPIYSSDTRISDHGQLRSRATPTPTETQRPGHEQVHLRATPASTQTTSTGHDEYMQCATPSRSGAHSSEYEKPHSRSNEILNGTPKAEYDENRCRENIPQGEAHRSDYDQPKQLSTPTSIETSKARTKYGTQYVGTKPSHHCTSVSSSTNEPRSTGPRALTQVDGSPERDLKQSSCDLDRMFEYQAGLGVKILKAPSTMWLQPKMSYVDPEIAAAKLRSSVWRTSSRNSADSASLNENEPVNKAKSISRPEGTAPDQMDGAVDFIASVPSSRASFIDLRGEFERRAIRDIQISSLPVLKSRSQPRTVLTKKNGQGRKSSWTSLRKPTPNCTSQGCVKPGVNKVMGLAAIFDTAAKASPFVPTPGGAIQEKRRETAGVISPYTSNPSPRASLQPVTSVSTPISLMSPTRLSIHISTPGESSGRKCMIPRLQHSSATHSAGRTETYMSPISAPRNDSRVSVKSSNNPSRLSTPSRLPVKKRISNNETPPLPQFDGLSGTKQSLLKLTAQQEIRPVGFHSSPIPQIRGGYKGIPRLSHQSTSSRYSDETGLSRESNTLSLTPSRGRIASSLRDQIRSLRTELSAKNEDYAQLRLDLEESRKMKEVNEILLREDLDRARSDTQRWRRRAERAEKKVDKYERLAMQIKDARDYREKQGPCADDYSFMSGSDHLTISDRAASQPLTTRMNQSIRRTPPLDAHGANGLGAGDGFSECSGSTIVRNVVDPDENGPVRVNGLWSVVDELIDFTSPGGQPM
ncbi:hypothetical protein N0V82_008423 [Gnomoniopsis sp. IMI 355080]|nr:hypothetical protein N0V82_008423 [Gnomoniopsis sp. IMI 355080]